MENYQKTLLLGILIIILLFVHYHKSSNIEPFVANCHNPQFDKEVNGNIIKYCAEIDGIGHGCNESDLTKTDPALSAFSIFGSYIDNLDNRDINTCLQRNQTAKTLSDWGLCEQSTISKIRGFGYKENEELLNAIQLACNFYKNSKVTPTLQ